MAEAWRVGISLVMSSNHDAVLAALASQLLGIHTTAKKLEGTFNTLKVAITGALSA